MLILQLIINFVLLFRLANELNISEKFRHFLQFFPYKVTPINPFHVRSLLTPPENIRKPEVFWCFQGVSKEISGMKWVKIIKNYSYTRHWGNNHYTNLIFLRARYLIMILFVSFNFLRFNAKIILCVFQSKKLSTNTTLL